MVHMRSAKKISVGKSVGIHIGYLCIHKDNVKMYFNKRGCTMSSIDSRQYTALIQGKGFLHEMSICFSRKNLLHEVNTS